MRQTPFPYTLDIAAIPVPVLVAADDPTQRYYPCPDACWRAHLEAWSRARRQGRQEAPQPMPWGHLMFAHPGSYGKIPYGCTDEAVRRTALERTVRAMLTTYDRDVPVDVYERIVAATVEAKMCGQETGATPFLACIAAAAL